MSARLIALVLLFVVSATATAFAAPLRHDAPIDVAIRPIHENDAAVALAITVSFTGEADGETLLVLPNEWGGEVELYRALHDFSVQGGVLLDGAAPHFKLIRHAPRTRITLTYRVRHDAESVENPVHDERYRAMINPTYIHVLGNAVFALPQADSGTAAQARFEGVKKGWTLASDLEHGNLTLERLIDSVTVIGDFRVLTPSNGPQGLRVAMRSADWSFQPQEFVDRIGAIVQAQRSFWGTGDEQYLVSILPFPPPGPGWVSIGGTGRGDGFALFATTNANGAPLTRLLAHESLHTWIPGRIGAMPIGPQEASAYWMSEGFTDFYTDRLLVRAGHATPAVFADEFDRLLFEAGVSPVRDAPNAAIVDGFWTNADAQILPYQRGRLIAFLIDDLIRKRSGGRADLDDVVLAMQARSLGPSGPQPIRTALVGAVARFGVDIAPVLEQHIDVGVPILLPADLLGPCGVVKTVSSEGPFHRGFDIERTQAANDVISGVVPNGPAYRAGMRDGMKLLQRVGGRIGDPTQEIAYRVLSNGAEQIIRYLPFGSGAPVTIQRFEPKSEIDSAACRARMAGDE